MNSLPAAVAEFVESIKDVAFFSNAGAIDPAWRMFETRKEAWYSCRNEPRSASWKAAVNATKNAVKTGLQAEQYNEAWYLAWGETWRVVGNHAADAARDAALLAQCLLVEDQTHMTKWVAYSRERWAVWQAGYGLFEDVDLTNSFYVYKRRPIAKGE